MPNVAMMFVARCVVSAILFGAAAVLCWFGKDGWGWMLFVGLLVVPGWHRDDDDECSASS